MLSNLILLGAAWFDFVSLARWVRLRKTGRGPGGIPVLAWLVYSWICVGQGRWLMLVALTGYHLACHVIVPRSYRLWVESESRPRLTGR